MSVLTRTLLLLLTLACALGRKTFPKQLRQWPNCNNCYAVTAYDLIKYHQPRLNLTLEGLMRESQQTCNGGVPTTILDRYFPRGSRRTTGSLRVLQRVLREHGPASVSLTKGHLVTAVRASEHGVLVRDPADGKQRLVRLDEFYRRRETLYFSYIAFPLL
tara:strand:- start:924 stop:1403 length:480 start_codon:yes stop_codon:yes gene_type:complete